MGICGCADMRKKSPNNIQKKNHLILENNEIFPIAEIMESKDDKCSNEEIESKILNNDKKEKLEENIKLKTVKEINERQSI